MIKENCLTCNKVFYIYPYEKKIQKYCSWDCRPQHYRKGFIPWNKGTSKKAEIICMICKNKFTVPLDQLKHRVPKYCSIKCRGIGYRGNKNNFWKGGIYPLVMRIRDLQEMTQWRVSIFQRDKRICQNCGQNKMVIEAHHIKPLSILLQEFLSQYSQFSPIEDKETLVRLAITYEPFWDISNGETLCEKCHNKTKVIPLSYKKLTFRQTQVNNLIRKGTKVKDIANKFKITSSRIYEIKRQIKYKQYFYEADKDPRDYATSFNQ